MRHEPSGIASKVIVSWKEGKLFFEHSVSVSPDALHLIAGVLIMMVFAFLLRKPVSSRWPWLVVLLFTCLNEAIDLWVDQWPSPGMQFGESAKDIFVTMLMPTLLLFTARETPQLYIPKSKLGPIRVDSEVADAGPV